MSRTHHRPHRTARPGLRVLFAALLVAAAGLVLVPALPAHAAGAHTVTMSGYAFHPAALTVTAGDTITWTNQDTAPHDVEMTSGPQSAHSPMLSKGQSWSFAVTAAGSYSYVCTVHPGMAARLTVTAPPTHAAPAPTHAAPAPAPAPATHAQQNAPAPAPAPTTAAHQHPATPATPAPAASSAAAAAPAASTAPATAAAQAAPTPVPVPAPAAQAADPSRPLRPLLLLAALVAGVSVVCLLLVGSRSSAARKETL